jgi:hypothetical protein
MQDFTAMIATCHSYVKTILICVDRLQEIRGQVQTAVSTEKETEISRKIDNFIGTVQENQGKMKSLMERLQASVKTAKDSDPVRTVYN